jgi:hypothetical protein
MEHVTFSHTFPLSDTHPALPYLYLIPQTKNERREERKKETGREGEKERKCQRKGFIQYN